MDCLTERVAPDVNQLTDDALRKESVVRAGADLSAQATSEKISWGLAPMGGVDY
jgi:hypothetical protein